jgi:hypothetical protein
MVAIVIVLVLLGAVGGAAWAYWLAGTTAGSNGAAAATTVNAGATPTASATGAAVTVSWAASTLASGQAVTGYQIKRYAATTLIAQTILSNCAGVVSSTSCTENAVPDGSWKYTVTPVLATNWQGAESAKSATVVVDTVPPTNSISLSNITGRAYLTGTNVYYAGSAVGSLTLTNAVTDAGSGPASSQTAVLTGTTTGWTHTPSTVSTPAGGPYVSNTFNWAAATSSGPGEIVTGRDVTGNSTTTSLTFVNDSTAPSGSTVTYADGLTGGTTVSVSFTAGTDVGSGIGIRLLQRASAPATMAGTCGSYGSFATVTGGTNPVSPVVDTVSLGNCYKYQYVVSDNVGNSTTATNTNVARAPYGATYALDENTGTSANDSSDMGNTATLQAAASWTTGRFGSAVSLTGASTSWVDIPRPVIDTSKSYSVALWVKLNSLSGNQTFASMDGTNISPFYLQLTTGNFSFVQRSSDSTGASITQVLGPPVVTGEWYHVVGVYNTATSTIQLYVNGISQGTATYSSGWAASGHTTIGRAKFTSQVDFVNGAIDDVHFYDRAITASEVVTLRGPFGAYWAFNAGSGTTAVDSTGNTNTGTLQASAGWTTGKIGSNALNLNGTSTSYVDVNTPVIDSSQSYTVATWVKLNSLTTFQTFASIDGANISPFFLQMDSGGAFRFTQYSGDSTGAANVSVAGLHPTAGTWYHVVGVYDKTANTVQLYVNGVSQGSATAVTPWTAWGHTSVGRSKFTNPTDFVNGSLDETRFYDRALNSSEVAALAGTYSTVVNGTSGLLDYWRLGEASGTTATDSIGADPGTYVNSPTLGAAGASINDSNTAVTFNGTTQYATATRTIGGDFSVEFWVNSTQNYSNDFGYPHCTYWWQGASLVDADASGSANDFGVSMCSGKIIAGVGNPDTNVVSSGTYNDGAWHQVVMTRTQSTGLVTLYVDGASAGSVTGNTNALTASANVFFARSASASTNFLAGTLDEIAFYNVALPSATVLSHYQAGG